MTTQDISIIIVNYNGKRFLQACLTSLRETEARCSEVIIVDNGSTDGSQESVLRSFPECRLVQLERNHGFARANNIAAGVARGEYLVFLNNDTIVTPGWLSALLDVMRNDSSIGVTGSKLMLYPDTTRIQSAGANIVLTGKGYDIGFGQEDSGQYDAPAVRGSVCGASLMVRKNEFLEFGAFDDDYFMYLEDVDLCWRYWLYGRKVMYVPASKVLHHYGGTTGTERHTPSRIYYGTRNALINSVKNYEAKRIALVCILAPVFDLLRLLFLMARFRARAAFSVIRAYISFMKMLPAVLVKRRVIQSRRRVGDKFLVDHKLIVGLLTSAGEIARLIRGRARRG